MAAEHDALSPKTSTTKGDIEYSGKLLLKNRTKKKWKERWCVLFADRRLCYWSRRQDFEHAIPAKACIDLSLTQTVEILSHKNGVNGAVESLQSPSEQSLSRKGSMDFQRIFSHKNKHKNKQKMFSHCSGDDDEEDDHEHIESEPIREEDVFKIVQSRKTYAFCVMNNHALFAEWVHKFELIIFGNALHKGFLFQLSKTNIRSNNKRKQKWMKRWFILYDRKELRYYNNAAKKVAFGIVILSNLTAMSKSEDYKAKKKYGQSLFLIKLQFESTIIILASLDAKQRNQWYHQINYCISKKSKKAVHLLCVPDKSDKSQTIRSKSQYVIPSITQSIAPITPSSMSMTMSPSASNHNSPNNIIQLHNHNHNAEILELQNEILYLKAQMTLFANNHKTEMTQMNCWTIDDIDNELLDVDQYLILDKNWRNWSYLEIVEWVTNLEHGRYNKYKTTLFTNMKYREMQGSFLNKIDKSDLTNFFGITHFGDVTDLYKQIRRLIKI